MFPGVFVTLEVDLKEVFTIEASLIVGIVIGFVKEEFVNTEEVSAIVVIEREHFINIVIEEEHFVKTIIEEVHFVDIVIKEVHFVDIVIKEVHFVSTVVKEVHFVSTIVKEVHFVSTIVKKGRSVDIEVEGRFADIEVEECSVDIVDLVEPSPIIGSSVDNSVDIVDSVVDNFEQKKDC